MKPIHLSLSGLQSYRDKQEVDFTKLCDAGVFGIFGPTGSGKSTILDAVTLALFGRVERAPGGTQGIMNQSENILSVSFTFELSSADGVERYRVDRQYKRNPGGEQSVNNTICRLLRLDGLEPVVLADKAGEVNARVQEILGLSMQDFTRAVVLPQGKFAEFLSLKGVERRQMLQRLFHLEAYGDLLNGRLSLKAKETDLALKQMEAEQQGLGDASEAALEAAVRRMNEARAAATEQRLLLLEAERRVMEQRGLKELEAERLSLNARLEELSRRKPEMEEGTVRLRRSEQASRIAGLLEELEHTAGASSQAARALEVAEKAHQEALSLNAAAENNYEEAKTELDQNDGPLQIRIERLKQALMLAEEIQRDRAREADLAAREKEAAEGIQRVQEEILKERSHYEKGMQLQAELRDRLSQKEIKPERRELVQHAMRDKERLDGAHKRQAELQQELRTAADKHSKAGRTWAQLQEERKEAEIRSYRLSQEALSLLQRMGHADDALLHLVRRTKEAKDAETAIGRQSSVRLLATKLAQELAHGEACPVCGSLEHPSPAHELSNGMEDFSEQKGRELDELLQRLSEAQFETKQAGLSLKLAVEPLVSFNQNSAIAEAASAMETTGNEAAGAAGFMVEDDSAEASLEEAEIRFAQWSEGWSSVREEAHRITEETRSCMLAFSQVERREGEQKAELRALAEALSAHESRSKALEDELQGLIAAWRDAHPAFVLEEAEVEWERLKALDREAEELKSRLLKSDPYLEEQLRKMSDLEQKLHRLERSRGETVVERKGIGELLLERNRRYKELMGEDDRAPEPQLQEAESRLLLLRRSVSELGARLNEARNELQRLSSGLAAAAQEKETSRNALERAEAKWREALSGSVFETPNDVRAALLDADQASRLKQELDSYKEQSLLLEDQLSRLQQRLAGRVFAEEDCLMAEQVFAAEKEKDEASLQARAKAERDLEELESKHQRWCELDRKRLELSELAATMQKLQSVLRGNAFVEYIAEEQLMHVSRAASERLGQLTRRRYALETDSGGGFVIRDDANGGLRRPVSTLSGGETFLTSLSLALALSAQIQLSGKFPLEFFFLDEGFGTLDPDLLDSVVSALEKLHMEKLTVGVISHVPELKARLPRRLMIMPAEPSGEGSRISFESI